MTASRLEHENTRLHERARILAQIEGATLLNFLQALALMLPFAFLALSGPLFALGVLYALVYIFLMLLPTALYILMSFDAVRVLTGRSAVFVPVFIAVGRGASKKATWQKKTLSDRILELSVTGNPLASLTRELWFVAFRFNRAAIQQIEESANRLSKNTPATGITGHWVAVELRTVPTQTPGIELVMC